jgi:hypothetical protein
MNSFGFLNRFRYTHPQAPRFQFPVLYRKAVNATRNNAADLIEGE